MKVVLAVSNVIPIPAAPSTGSPFDEIRSVRSDGSEYWSARDLMPLLGYEKWERFSDAIERAIAALTAQGSNVDQEVSRLREPVVTSGNAPNTERADYHLTRFAAYQVAMCGDPRKPEVAAALAYFAIRTREAEMMPTDPFDLIIAQAQMMKKVAADAAAAKQIAEDTSARLDGIEGRHDWYSALGYARREKITNTSTAHLNRVGRQASSIAKRNGIKAMKVPHALYGEVNSYPAWVWELAFADRR